MVEIAKIARSKIEKKVYEKDIVILKISFYLKIIQRINNSLTILKLYLNKYIIQFESKIGKLFLCCFQLHKENSRGV